MSGNFGLKKFVPKNRNTKDTLLSALAEFIGTAMLVFLGCMGCVKSLGVVPSHLQITLNFGLVVLLIIQCIAHISHAHINPAITLGAFILGKKNLKETIFYMIAQVLGGIGGFALLKVLTPWSFHDPPDHLGDDNLCVTDLHVKVSAIQGLMLEAAATAILMFVACAVWDRRNEKTTDSVAIKFGLTITGLATAIGPYTGCSMNPARSFAPALFNNYWTHQWIYWLGPLAGSAIVTFFYKSTFAEDDHRSDSDDETDENSPQVVALNNVEAQKSIG